MSDRVCSRVCASTRSVAFVCVCSIIVPAVAINIVSVLEPIDEIDQRSVFILTELIDKFRLEG